MFSKEAPVEVEEGRAVPVQFGEVEMGLAMNLLDEKAGIVGQFQSMEGPGVLYTLFAIQMVLGHLVVDRE